MSKICYVKTKLRKGARPLAIVLALVLVFGIFIGITVLVVPELIEAVKLIIQIAGGGLDQLAQMETNTALMGTPVGQYFAKLDIDWLGFKNTDGGMVQISCGAFVNQAGAAGSFAGSLVTFSIGLVFAIYILSGKEKLKHQVCRLIHVWLPEKFGENADSCILCLQQNFSPFYCRTGNGGHYSRYSLHDRNGKY